MGKRLFSLVLCLSLVFTMIALPEIGYAGAEDVIIIDNLDAGFSSDSTWTTSVSVAGGKDGDVYFNGTNYFHDGSANADPDKWAKWTPNIPADGEYRIYMMWAKATNRTGEAPIEIKHKGGVDQSITVNQKQKGGLWNLLGTYTLTAGTDNYVKILASATGYTIADAVMFEKINTDPYYVEDIIIDNEDAGCILVNDPNSLGTDGIWKTSTTTPGSYRGSYATTSTDVASAATATWTPNIQKAGKYNVYMQWSALNNRTSAAPIEIKHDEGIFTSTINERTNGGQWNLLGTFNFSEGLASYVKLFASSSGFTTADAVKFEYVSPFGVIDVSDYQVYQRTIGSTTGSVPISFENIYNNIESVKARVLKYGTDEVVVDWTDIASTVIIGTGSKNITVPQGGWYQTEIAGYDAIGTLVLKTLSNKKWGVGINILCVGQSNMEGNGRTPYTVAHDLVSNFSKSNNWGHLVDPYSNIGGSMTPSLGNKLVEKYNIPVGFVPAAVAGSGLCPGSGPKVWSSRNASDPADTSTYYGNSIARARAAGGVELIVWNQGETDGRYVSDYNNYITALNKLIQNYRTDIYSTIPFFYGQIGVHNVTDTINNDAWYSGIRTAQALCDNEDNNVYMASSQLEFPLVDDAHYTTLSQNTIGNRFANAIMYYYGDASYYRGPRIDSASFINPTTIDVKISHVAGTDIITEGNISGFTVLSDDAPVNVISATKQNSDTIRLTLESNVGGNAFIRYLYGVDPDNSNVAKDNSELQLPLECTISDVPVLVGDVTITVGDKITISSSVNLTDVTLIVAGYNGNSYNSKYLVGVKIFTVDITKNITFEQQIPTELLSCETIKVMLWDKISTISPLAGFAVKSN